MTLKPKIFAVISAFALILPFTQAGNAKAISFSLKDPIYSESALLINLDCDTVIHDKSADTKEQPGPLVNIMTAVVCLENCPDLKQEVTIDESVWENLYNTEYYDDLRFAEIYDGDKLSYQDLLYAMMLTSSVEASQTIAYEIGGKSVSGFVQMMNDKAQEIGLTSTYFTNPTGMYDPNQYTTARDMATLTEYALTLPMFDNIASAQSYSPSVPNLENHPDQDEWVWYHSNTMTDPDDDYYYPGVRGVKTANLEKGGRSIVTLASKDGHNYLLVAMNAPMVDENGDVAFYHLDDATYLLDWAFEHFSYQTILANTTEIQELPVDLAEGDDGYVLVKPKEDITMLWYDDVDISLIRHDKIRWYKTDLTAPVKKGEILGEVTLEYSGEEIATTELVAVSDVKRSWSKYNLYAVKLFPKSDWFRKALTVSCVLSAIYIILCIYSYIMYKRNERPIKPLYLTPDPKKIKKSDNKKKSKKRKK